MSLVAEQSRLNKELKGHHATSRKILSAKAITIIAKNKQYTIYANRVNAMEPPFMAPLTDPGQYLKVFTDITCKTATSNIHHTIVEGLDLEMRGPPQSGFFFFKCNHIQWFLTG